MTTKKATRKAVPKSPKQIEVQKALETTWVLKGQLKSAQLSYLRIGSMLYEVREKKMDATLKHPSLEDYAEKRLGMRRSALYKYLQVYEWAKEFHPEWLGDKPKGFIPVLNDVADLMWIERKLQEKGLSSQTRSELETLRQEALQGTLKESDLAAWQKKGKRSQKTALRTLVSQVRTVRRHAAELKEVPPEVLTDLDAAIKILQELAAKLGN